VKAEQLEEGMYEVIDDLKAHPVSAEELQKVKNQLRVQNIRFMDLMSGIGILFYLGQNAAFGDWTEANNGPKKIDLVTPEDITRVANKYFTQDQRNVLIINAKAGAESGSGETEDPRMAQMIQMVKGITDADQLEQMMGMLSSRMDQEQDPQRKAGMEKLMKIAGERLKELKAADKK
jgi:hypothetical protein